MDLRGQWVRRWSALALVGQGSGPFEQGRDGLVTYESAHITPVESELVVRSGHSVQGDPACIEEIRRILLEHAASGS